MAREVSGLSGCGGTGLLYSEQCGMIGLLEIAPTFCISLGGHVNPPRAGSTLGTVCLQTARRRSW